MKKFLGYLFIIVLGLGCIISLMVRSNNIDNNYVDGSNTIELFAKN